MPGCAPGCTSHMRTTRSGSGYGNGRNRTPSMTEKMAEVPPTASAIVIAAAVANPRLADNTRNACLTSRTNVSMRDRYITRGHDCLRNRPTLLLENRRIVRLVIRAPAGRGERCAFVVWMMWPSPH